MTIKEIRKLTNLKQQEFADKYEIPLGTLKQWESSLDASYHRECPIYVKHLLERVVKDDIKQEAINSKN